MVSDRKLAAIIQLRGLGWQQDEIAAKIGVSEKTVSYHLAKLRRISEKNPDVFWEIMASAGVAWLAGKLRKLERL